MKVLRYKFDSECSLFVYEYTISPEEKFEAFANYLFEKYFNAKIVSYDTVKDGLTKIAEEFEYELDDAAEDYLYDYFREDAMKEWRLSEEL